MLRASLMSWYVCTFFLVFRRISRVPLSAPCPSVHLLPNSLRMRSFRACSHSLRGMSNAFGAMLARSPAGVFSTSYGPIIIILS